MVDGLKLHVEDLQTLRLSPPGITMALQGAPTSGVDDFGSAIVDFETASYESELGVENWHVVIRPLGHTPVIGSRVKIPVPLPFVPDAFPVVTRTSHSEDLLLHVGDNHFGEWLDFAPGCTLHAEIKPHPHAVNANHLEVSDVPDETQGDAWLATMNPLLWRWAVGGNAQHVPPVVMEWIAATTSPLGGGVDWRNWGGVCE